MPRDISANRDSLTDAVIHEIEGMILRGEVRPGDWLTPQPELARQLGVGLSTVREAIKGLTLLGVLEPQPGRGTWIHADAPALLRMLSLLRTSLARQDIAVVYEARRLLEVELTTLAAERATPEAISQIEAALARMRAAIDDNPAFMEADLTFHLAVAHAAGNPLLEQFYLIAAEMAERINEQIAAIPGVKDVGLQLQEQTLDAIRRHDPPAARRLALRLVERWREILRMVGDAAPVD